MATETGAEAGQRSLRPTALAALGSIGCIGLLLANAIPEGLLQPVLIVASVLWLMGIGFAASRGSTALGGIAASSVAIYAVAFILPAVLGTDGSLSAGGLGYVAFGVGLMVVPIAWFANPMYLIALLVARRGGNTNAAVLAALATAVALSVPFTLGQVVSLSVGYAAWVVAPGVLALGTAIAAMRPGQPAATAA